MGNCGECKFYQTFGAKDPDGEVDWGECRHEKINKEGDEPENAGEGQLLAGGGHEGYGEFLKMHKDFGCVCFEIKEDMT